MCFSIFHFCFGKDIDSKLFYTSLWSPLQSRRVRAMEVKSKDNFTTIPKGKLSCENTHIAWAGSRGRKVKLLNWLIAYPTKLIKLAHLDTVHISFPHKSDKPNWQFIR